jgi:hypothetical protein
LVCAFVADIVKGSVSAARNASRAYFILAPGVHRSEV